MRLSPAGGAKHLVHHGTPQFDFMIGQIATSLKLHNPPKIDLLVHTDCGAYKGLIPEGDNEEEFLSTELLTAKKNVEEFLASINRQDVKVGAYLVTFDGVVSVEPELVA